MKPGAFPRRLRRAASTVALAGLLAGVPAAALPALAAERPKWEAGMGGVFFTQPDYIGSDEYRFRAIPFPWIIYRGERLRMDRDSVQARLFGTDLVRLDLSAGGQVSVDSSDNDRRHGMPDLDWIAQVGPALRFLVADTADGRHVVDVEVPVRTAISVALDHVAWQGFVSSPKLRWRFEPEDWRFEANAGLEFGDNEYHEYIYGVAPRFATTDRPVYRTEAGYAGIRLAAGASRYFGPFYVGVFARYHNLAGATFGDSPLVGSEHAAVGGIAIGWVWSKSDEMVPVGAEANRRAREERIRRASGVAGQAPQDTGAAGQEAEPARPFMQEAEPARPSSQEAEPARPFTQEAEPGPDATRTDAP